MDMVLFKIKRSKEMRYTKLLKNSFVFVIILCLTFVTVSQSASANEPTSNELAVLEDNLVNELELVGIEEADVNIMLPMESQSNKVEAEVESVYEDKLSTIIDKPLEEVDKSDLKEVIQDVEAERIDDIKVEDVQEFEEVFFTNEEAGEDNELIEEMKEDLSIENENIVDKNDIVIEVTGKDDMGESFTTALGFSIGDNVIDIVNDTGVETNNEYKLELNDLSEEEFNADLTNLSTNQKVELNNTDGEFQTSAFWIPALGVFVGLSMLEMLAISVGASTLIYLASKGMINLVSGALWVAGKVANDNKKNKKYVHYEATRANNSKGIWVGPGKTKTKAISRIKNGKDCWSIDSVNARLLATGASKTGRYLKHDAHSAKSGKRTFNHYHPYETTGAHSFYGGGKLW